MKSIRNLLAGTFLAAGALMAASSFSIASAADDATSTTTTPPPDEHGWHHHGRGEWHLLSKLGLSAAQQASIKTIFTNARPQMQSLHQQMRANALKLQQTQPTDANYSSIASQASQTHGSLAAQLMTEKATVRAEVFKVLTPAQQTQLATLEAQMQARHAARAEAPAAGTAQ
jgi:Spy/CpxP family protein refolding chaperone